MRRSTEGDSPAVSDGTGGILFAIAALEFGGAERNCLTYLSKLRTHRRVLALLVGRGPLAREIDPAVPVFDLGFRQHHAYKFKPLYIWSLLMQARALARLAHQTRCGVVSSFLTHSNVSAILAKILFDRRLKIVINVHDITSRILIHSQVKSYQRFTLRWLIRTLYPRADLIVAVADIMKSDLIEQFGIPAETITVVHNPIDLRQIKTRAADPVTHPWFTDRTGPLVVAVGRLVRLKGYDLLIHAFAQVSQEASARLVILGDGEERPRLEVLIEQLGLEGSVALMGFQDNPWKYMARADIFVLSSLVEGLPNVVGEAMALGLPVLATDCSAGVREYVQDGQNGLLVPPGDVNGLYRGLERLIVDDGLRQRLAQGARERATAFDIEKAVETYGAALVKVMRG